MSEGRAGDRIAFAGVRVEPTSPDSAADGQTSDIVTIDVGDGSQVVVYRHMTGQEDPYYLVIEVTNDEGVHPALKVVRNDRDVYVEGIEQ